MANIRPLVALVDTTGKINFDYLQKIAKAMQIQVSQDVKKSGWTIDGNAIDAEIIAYKTVAEIPFGAWKVTVMNTLDIDVYGYHYIDEKGLPYAVLRYSSDLTLTISHEVIEMLIDPQGNRIIMSPEEFKCNDCLFGIDTTPIENRENIEILVEVSDPSQSTNFGYDILVDGEKIRCSDFFYPSYYDLVYRSGTQYSHTGAITRPKEILSGGYASFRNRLGEWWQVFNSNGRLIYKKVGDGETLSSANIQTVLTAVLVFLGTVGVLILAEKLFKRIFKRKANG